MEDDAVQRALQPVDARWTFETEPKTNRDTTASHPNAMSQAPRSPKTPDWSALIWTERSQDAPGLLATRCRVAKATLVHYSTDYVFNGRAQEPYPVDAPRDPVNAYGRTKALGEENIERAGGGYLIVRTSWLYAPWGKNFVRTIARAAAQRDSLRVVDDQRGRPTSSTHLAASTLGLIESGATGMFHVTDGGECTWFDLAAAIVANVDPSCRVEPCTTDEYPTPAARPEYSVLDVSLTEQRLGPMPDWRQNLAEVLDHLEPLT